MPFVATLPEIVICRKPAMRKVEKNGFCQTLNCYVTYSDWTQAIPQLASLIQQTALRTHVFFFNFFFLTSTNRVQRGMQWCARGFEQTLLDGVIPATIYMPLVRWVVKGWGYTTKTEGVPAYAYGMRCAIYIYEGNSRKCVGVGGKCLKLTTVTTATMM